MTFPFSVESPLVILVQWLGPQGVIGLLFGTGFLGALAKILIDKYLKPKVERTALANTEHERVSTMSVGLADRMEKEINRLSDEVAELRDEIKTERGEREKLGDKVQRQNGKILTLRMYISRVSDFWTFLTEHWDEIRLRPTPPDFPHYIDDEV